MHIAYIHQHFSTTQGTTGTRSYDMSRRLIRAGHRVTMVCGAFDSSDMSAAGRGRTVTVPVDGIDVVRINTPYSNKMGFSRRLAAFGRFARQAAAVVCRLDADLVFATSTPLSVGIPGMRGARRLGVPFVFEVRDLWPSVPIAIGALRNPLLIWYSRRLERRVYQAAAHIVALSPGIRAGIVRTGYPADRVSVIPNGCDLELFRPCAAPLDDPRFGDRDEFKLIYTGTHGPANGLDAVLDAAGVLRARGAQGIRLVFLGSGSTKERLIRRAHAEGLDGLVRWVDPVPKAELARILPRMDVGLMVLRNLEDFYYGTSPNKFADYTASGLPVLNNYPGWLATLIRQYQCGRVVAPDEPAAFADAVLWLAAHRGELAAMGRRSRQLAEERFGRDRLSGVFVECLERVAATAGSGPGHAP